MNESNLHKYQIVAVVHIMSNFFSGLFLDMGLGKTVSTLTAIYKLIFEELDVDRVLIIAPKRVAENVWTSELEKWDHLKGLKIEVIAGNPQKRREILTRKAHIFTISRDNLAWLCGEYGGSKLPFDMYVVDESSSFKSHKSQRFKAFRMVQSSFRRGVILTGTPAPNSLIDLWPQVWLLDRGERLGKTITHYRDKFFNPGKRNGAIIYDYKPQDDGAQRIQESIGDIIISMKAKDYLELPPRIDNFVEIEFDPATKKKYQDFERDQVLAIFGTDKEVTALNAAALSNKLLQFANGAVYDEDRNVHEMHDLKIEALEEIIESANGNPVLVAYTYQHDLERIMRHFKKLNPVRLKTGEDIDNWNAGKIQLMVMHPASGGHGLNLQTGGNIIVWFGQTWSLELYQQFNARIYRQGQEKPSIINHLISKGTIDADVIKALDRKDQTQESLMEAVKYRISKYLK